LGLRETRYQGSGDDYIMRSLILCTPLQILLGDKIKKNGMSVARSTYGGEERCIQDFGGEPEGMRPLERHRHR
jgi:hypothetical protein